MSTGASITQDPLVRAALGSWRGDGEADGRRVRVTRRWETTLFEQFLCAQMEVGGEGEEGASFPAVAYWRPQGGGRYKVAWLDGAGSLGLYEALHESAAGRWVLTWREEDTGEQRLILSFPRKDECTEELQVHGDLGWRSIGRFALRRG